MPSKLFAPITITHCPGPGGGHFIKHTYYFKAISGLVGQAGLEPAMLDAPDLQSGGVTNFPTDPYGERGGSRTRKLQREGLVALSEFAYASKQKSPALW